MPEQEKGSTLDTFEKVTHIASSLSVIFGVVLALMGIYNAVEESSRAVQLMKLNALPQITELLEDESVFRSKISDFLDQYDSDGLMALVRKYGSGERAYLSDELASLREIARQYEKMGALIRYGYIDFDLIFAIVPFPDNFWNETEAFREELRRRNWSEDLEGLPNLWENFEYLRERYKEQHRDRMK